MTFRDNDIRVLRFFVTEIFSHLAKGFFFLPKCLQNKQFLSQDSKDLSETQKKYHGAATYMKITMKVFTGLNLSGAHSRVGD
jgi:hypothetical protein